MSFINLISAMALSYIIGAIPTSYIIARLMKGVDIREHGSGNVGATNLMRVAGRLPGTCALLLDVAKGVIPVTLLASLFYSQGSFLGEPLFKVILGLSAVSGHVWTIFLRFKGGKGVATTIGVFIGLSPALMLLALIIWMASALISQYVSLSSLIMAASLPVLMAIFSEPFEYIMLSAILCVFIAYSHRSNIRRLMDGSEYKIGQKAKNK